MTPELEARIVEWRRAHPTWGPRTIVNRLAREGIEPLPGRSSVYRALIRHGLIDPKRRRRRRSDYKRWERARAMELWQMDVTGGVRLVDGSQPSVVTGVDDYSRFCVSAMVVARATAKPVCDALAQAMRTHGLPEAILTDNGKVFTGRFGPGTGEVLFDRICRENGIKHLLTAPHSPTTTGKVERFHKTMKREFLDGKVFESIADAQRQLDGWIAEYNHEREHQSLGDRPPIERFRLAHRDALEPVDIESEPEARVDAVVPAARSVARMVDAAGRISIAGFRYHVGRWLALETVDVHSRDGLIELFHDGVLVATHARASPAREGTGRATPTRPAATHAEPVDAGDPQGRRQRLRKLRRRLLSRRQHLSPPPGRSVDRWRQRADQLRRPTHPHPSDPSRPDQGTRCLRQPRRATEEDQCRLEPSPHCRQRGGAKPSHGYRSSTGTFSAVRRRLLRPATTASSCSAIRDHTSMPRAGSAARLAVTCARAAPSVPSCSLRSMQRAWRPSDGDRGW